MNIIKKGLSLIFRLLKKVIADPEYRIRKIYAKVRKKEPLKEKMIFYEAYHGKSMTGNPYAVFTYLLNDPHFKEYEHIWAIDDVVIPARYKNHLNVSFVKHRGIDYVKYLATAKYLINDTTFPYYFHKRDEQIYANIWHGTPFKTMGIDIKNRNPTDHKNIQRNFLSADFFVSPNEYTAKTLLKSHDIYTIYSGQNLDTGYPRVDLMYKAKKDKIKRRLFIPRSKKVILYAPTWRGEIGDKENQSEKILQDVQAIQIKTSKDYVVLIKAHHFSEQFFKDAGKSDLCVPNDIDTNELLSIVDILITDYSSIFFEFLPTEKPIIYYTYDAQSYIEKRGTYFDLAELPGPICKSTTEVIKNINQIKEVKIRYKKRYNEFINKFCYHDDGQATARFVDAVFHNKPSKNLISTTTNKTKILMYGGGFLNNGITASVISLLNTIDYTKYDVTLIDHGTKQSVEKRNNIKKVNNHVNYLYRSGGWNATLFDSLRHAVTMRNGLYTSLMKRIAPTHLYKNELKRTIGLTKFDIGIDFSGYSPFWASLFSFGNFKKKSIFLHSDMNKEATKKVNHKYPHRTNLKVIFSLYNFFDKIISVSKLTHEQNVNHLKTTVKNYAQKMDYVINSIDYDHILSLKDDLQYEFALEPHFIPNTLPPYPVPREDQINFITIGRLSPEKDHEKLLLAFSHITKNVDNCKLYIVGDGALKNQLVEQVDELNLKDKVIFTGQLTNPYALLSKCDCFVLSSNHEGQPIVLLEALILRIPTIVTDIPGSRSVVDGGYGLIVENTIDGLIYGMNKFIEGTPIINQTFDYITYRDKAITMFYEKVCNVPIEAN